MLFLIHLNKTKINLFIIKSKNANNFHWKYRIVSIQHYFSLMTGPLVIISYRIPGEEKKKKNWLMVNHI